MLKLYLMLTSAPSLTSALLQHLHASRTVAPFSVLPCTVQHTCASRIAATCMLNAVLGFSALYLPLSLHLHLPLPTHPVLLLLVGALVARSNPRGWVPQGSWPSSPVVLLTTVRCLPTSAQVVRAFMAQSLSVKIYFSACVGVALVLEDFPLLFFLGH